MPSLSESEPPSAGEPTQPMSSYIGQAADFGPLDATLVPPMRLRHTDPATPSHTHTYAAHSNSPTPFPGTFPARRMPVLPGYEVLGELGRGGMGVVYRARQTKLNRFVALKMLLNAESADLVDVVRFRSEAEAVAAVRHPHVVQVHEFGHFEGKPYLVLEFLPGGSLHNRIRTHSPIAPRDAAALLEKLARAVQAAHAQGIVHRDLKPGNVLYDESGEPRITDFGLAKRVSMQITQTQAVMGTPAYMSPEQANGLTKYVGPPTDIYALGIILYECLTGHPPFAGDDSVSVLHQVLNDSPRSIRAQVATVPRDLELICLKCLEKEAGDRYSTAAALADDLARYLAGQPVLVRAAGPLERAFKWARRRPTMATVYALSVLVLVITTVGLGIFGLWRQAVHARDEADGHSQRAELAKADADVQRRAAEESRDRLAAQNREIAEARRKVEAALGSEKTANTEAQSSAKVARDANAKTAAANETLEAHSYFHNVGFANLETRSGNVLRARQLLENCPENRRDWEWWHAYRSAHEEAASGSTNAVASDIAFAGRGHNVTTADDRGVITPFDMETGKGVPKGLVPKPKYHHICRISEDAGRMLSVRQSPEKAPDIATVWDTRTGDAIRVFPAAGRRPRSAAISGDRETILIGFDDPPHLLAYDVSTGKALGKLEGACPCERIGLNRDGTRAISIRQLKGDRETSCEIVVWETATGGVLAHHASKFGLPTALALDAAGTTAAIGFISGALTLYDVRTERAIDSDKAHTGAVQAVAVSRDGKRVASSGDDGIVRVCQAQTGALEQLFRGHTRCVRTVKFDSTGQLIASADYAQRFFVWDLKGTKQAIARLDPAAEMKGRFYADPSGNRCISSGDTGTAYIWDLSVGKFYPVHPPADAKFVNFAIDPKGTRFAGADDRGTVHLWDKIATVSNDLPPLETTGLYREIARGDKIAVETLAFSADGKRLLVADTWRVAVFDTATRQMIFSQEARHSVACISGDGRRVAVGSLHKIFVWTLDAKLPPEQYAHGNGWPTAIALNREGTMAALGMGDWEVYLLDLADADGKGSARMKAKLRGHSAGVRSLGFSPKGHRLVSGADDGGIRVWDTASGLESISVNIFVREPIRSIFFSAGGTEVIATPDKSPPFVLHGGIRPHVVPPRQ